MIAFSQARLPRICPRCARTLPPGGTICANCGLPIAQKRLEVSGLPTQPLLPTLSPGATRDRSPGHNRNRTALVYFGSILLFFVIASLFFLHSSGISLLSLFSGGTHPSKAITYSLPKEAPLFSDSFLSDTYGWNLQSSPGNYTVTLGNGTLSLQVEKHNLLWELLPGEKSFGNFTLTVNAVLSQGDQNNGYGVYIRGASDQGSDLATYYRFELYGDGSYAIVKGTRDASGHSSSTKIVDYTLSPAIRTQGKVNQIMIIAKGPALSLVVNGQLLKTISDTSYTSGSIALFVSNLPQAKAGAQATFSQLAIYPGQG